MTETKRRGGPWGQANKTAGLEGLGACVECRDLTVKLGGMAASRGNLFFEARLFALSKTC